MKLLGFVSDEMYVALADVQVEFESLETGEVAILRSSPRGAFYGLLQPDRIGLRWRKTVTDRSTVTMEIVEGRQYQFRLLSNTLLGYMWPKWVRAGETAEFRAHSPEQYQLTLWRYGLDQEIGSDGRVD